MIYKCVPTVPIASHPASDVFTRHGMTMWQYRAGVLIATHTLTSVEKLAASQFIGTGPITSFFVEEGLMSVATLDSVQIPASGPITVNYSDGTSIDYSDRTAIGTAVNELVDAAFAKLLLLARWRALNPALDNPDVINGTTVEINLASVLTPIAFGGAG